MQTHNYLNQLNKGQYEAATTIQGPVRILAGAGSGKTHTLISRVAYMIDCGISPEQILLLTFTNNAAKNMVERASTMANPKCANITACTYHSFCAKLLRQYGKFIGIESNFTILTPAEAADAVKLVKSQRPFYEKIRKFPEGLEWKHVFIIDCVEGICPFKKAKTDADFEEERRLFYVAMTRAKQYLYLCTYEQSGNKSVNPSPYLRSVSQK